MSYVTPLYNNFIRGEISQILAGRIDLPDYNQSLAILENFVVLPVGALVRRPGTCYVAEAKSGTVACRLIPYERGTVQNYVIELGATYARFYTNNTRIENPPGTPVEIATPWGTADLPMLKFAQDYDALWIVHPYYQPRRLRRTTDDYTWVLDTPIGAPFNSAGNYPSAICFWEGRMILAGTNNNPQAVWGSKVGDYTTWVVGTVISGPVLLPVASPGIVTWTAHGLRADQAIIFTTTGALPTGLTAGTTYYVVGTSITVNTFMVAATPGGTPINFTGAPSGTHTGTVVLNGPADPWMFQFASDRAQVVRWLVSGADLLVGASGGEWIFTGQDQPFYSQHFLMKQQTHWGSSPVQAVLFQDRVLYVQKTNNKLRELFFAYERNGYVSPDMTALAREILEGGVLYMEAQNTPYPILWVVKADNTLVAFYYDTSTKMAAWGRIPLEGYVESLATITTSQEDQLWLSIRITINGTLKRLIVYMKPFDWGTELYNAFFVDAGIALDMGGTKAIQGATQANPIRVQCNSHGFSNDQIVRIEGVVGMSALNGKYYMVKNVATHYFDLWLEDGSATIDGTFFYLTIDTPVTPAAWAPGATITGGSSGQTFEVFSQISDVTYLCRNLSGALTDGEILSDGVNSVDCGAGYPQVLMWYDTYSSGGTAQRYAKTITGLGHLEAEEVDVLADGASHPKRVVASGAITLSRYANKLVVGLPMASRLQLMRIEAGGESGPAVGKPKKINKVTLGFHETICCKVGPNMDQLTEMEFREPVGEMDEPPALFTGFKTTSIEGTWDLDGNLVVLQDQPLPMTITSIMPYVETKEL